MNAYEKGQIKKMAVEVKKHLETSDNISISVLNYGLELTPAVIRALEKEGCPVEKSSIKYSFMGYVTFRRPKQVAAAEPKPAPTKGSSGCGHDRCDCPDGVFYGRDEVSDADPGL